MLKDTGLDANSYKKQLLVWYVMPKLLLYSSDAILNFFGPTAGIASCVALIHAGTFREPNVPFAVFERLVLVDVPGHVEVVIVP